MSKLSLRFIRRAKTLQYDDTCQVLIDGNIVETFSCNTQPGTSAEGTATLAPGKYYYRTGIHGLSKPPSRRYAAFVQAAPVNVFRSGHKNVLFRVDYSINIHKGSIHSVSSLGCLTFHPDVWSEFKEYVYETLDKFDQSVFEVLLQDEIPTTQGKVQSVPSYTYRVHGKPYAPYTIQGGRAIVRVRAFIALLLGVEPNTLEFKWDEKEDLFYRGKKIEVIDCAGEEGVTYGTLASCVLAAGGKLLLNDAEKTVSVE